MYYIKFKITERQLQAIMEVTDVISGMIGVGNDFDDLKHEVSAIDRMLHKHGYKRNYK